MRAGVKLMEGLDFYLGYAALLPVQEKRPHPVFVCCDHFVNVVSEVLRVGSMGLPQVWWLFFLQ